MIYIKMDGKEIGIISYVKPKNTAEWIAVADMPPKPTVAEGEPEPRLMLVGGQLVWQVGKTAEEIAEERKRAYTEECDPYLVAYQGYLVEGDTAKAESARKAYLKAKAEVRKRLPYGE